MKKSHFLAVPFLALIISGCIPPIQENLVESKVVAKWKSGVDTVIRIRTPKGTFAEFKDPYFGDMKPETGECVTVWVQVQNGKEINIFTGRNITPCQSSR